MVVHAFHVFLQNLRIPTVTFKNMFLKYDICILLPLDIIPKIHFFCFGVVGVGGGGRIVMEFFFHFTILEI